MPKKQTKLNVRQMPKSKMNREFGTSARIRTITNEKSQFDRQSRKLERNPESRVQWKWTVCLCDVFVWVVNGSSMGTFIS